MKSEEFPARSSACISPARFVAFQANDPMGTIWPAPVHCGIVMFVDAKQPSTSGQQEEDAKDRR